MEDNDWSPENIEFLKRLSQVKRSQESSTSAKPSQALLDLAWSVAQSYQQHASPNMEWQEFPVFALAAATDPVQGEPVWLNPDPNSGEHWELTQQPRVKGGAFYLVFKVHPGSKDRYVGRKVQVTYDNNVYDLGVVNEEGIAERRFDGDVVLRPRETMVRIMPSAENE